MTQDTQTSVSARSVSPQLRSERLNREMTWQVASNLFVSFKYAWAGITYAFATQRNFRIHTIVGAVALSLAVWLGLDGTQIAVITLTSGAVMALELVNTALESVVDLAVQQTYHELARIAKDCAAGAVLVFAIVAVIVAATLLVPPLALRLQLLIQAV
jgi:diacylglycerol kinase (ATP)